MKNKLGKESKKVLNNLKGVFGLEITTTQACNFQCSYCITKDSKIFMSDFSTKKIKDIKIGDEILGFDEYKEKYKHRKIKPTKVLKIFEREEEVIKITLENGKYINITKNHKIYNNRSNHNYGMKEAGEYKINQNIMGLWYDENIQCDINNDYKIGYLLGIILGDRTLKRYKENHHGTYYDIFLFRLALKDIEPIERTKKYLNDLYINYILRDFKVSEKYNIISKAIFSGKKEVYEKLNFLISNNFRKNKTYEYLCGFLSGIFDAEGSHQKNFIRIFNTDENILNEIKEGLKKLSIKFEEDNKNKKCKAIRFCDSFDRIKFIQIVNPSIKRKGLDIIYDKKLLNSKKIIKIENIGIKKVYNIETESGTYIANGFAIHNCFERSHIQEEKLLDDKIIIKKIEEFLESNWFKKKYSGIKIILWGGEPTMNMPLCKSLMEYFIDNPQVCFFIYTNGSTIDDLLPILKRFKKHKFIKSNQSKITVQVSYDGNPIHDKNRKNKKGISTSKIVKNAIKKLHKENIKYGLKATMPWDDFKYMPQCWNDFNSLHDLFGSKIRYSLTVDYYNVKYDKYKEEVKKALIKVAQKEVIFFKKNNYFLSNIFKNNMSICATGKNMCVVDTNGDIYNCHGSIYSKCSDDFKYSNIFNKNFINNIEETNIKYKNNNIATSECKKCIATSCLRCNVKKYENSKKETHLEKWYDYSSQKDLCKYYQLIGKISLSIGSILRSK